MRQRVARDVVVECSSAPSDLIVVLSCDVPSHLSRTVLCFIRAMASDGGMRY
jgi:hypothetical protein